MTTASSSPTVATRTSLDVQIVGACYYLAPNVVMARLRALAHIFDAEGHGVTIRAVSMREQLPQDQQASVRAHWRQSGGAFLDISAYRSGLDAAPSTAICVLLNDTLFIRHPWRRVARRLTTLMPTLAASPVAAAAGELHPSTDLLLADPANPSRRHLSTFCFAINPAGRAILDEITATLPVDASTTAVQAWLDVQTAHYPALRQLLYVHLYASPNPWSWKRRSTGIAFDLLARKAVTVAVEYQLTARLLQQNGFVMPINVGLAYRLASKLAALRGR